MMDSCVTDAVRDRSDGSQKAHNVTESVGDELDEDSLLSLRAIQDIRSECAQWITSLTRYQEAAITNARERRHPIIDYGRHCRSLLSIIAFLTFLVPIF